MAELETRRLEPLTTITVRRETTPAGLSALFDTELPRVAARMDEVGAVTAVAVHVGPYDTLATTYDGLRAAIEAAGRAPGEGPWEVYLTDPAKVPDAADWLTEVIWPLE